MKSVMKNKQTGGKRKGSGRKPMDEVLKKRTVILYVAKLDMDKLGGESAFKDRCYGLLK